MGVSLYNKYYKIFYLSYPFLPLTHPPTSEPSELRRQTTAATRSSSLLHASAASVA
jgi:hypothetical protein